MTDRELLKDFVAERNEAAFRSLVVRHGPTVMGVCRRYLRDPHAVEDAFQATFLVFVRKAPTIRDPETLGNWFYGVARRVADRARRDALRRHDLQRRKAEMVPSHAMTDEPWDDSDGVIREEVERLPTDYRGPIELCYLLGRSHEDAAEELGLPLGTVKTRLVRGRRKLRDRLVRRGVALGLLLLLLPRPKRAAAVPSRLVDSTAKLMTLETAGLVAIDPRHARVSLLAGLVRPRAMLRRLGPLLLLLAAGVAATLGLALGSRARAAELAEYAALPASLTDVLNVECR